VVIPTNPLFKVGRVVLTPGAAEVLDASDQSPWTFLIRHMSGDWGELAADDKQRNDEAVRDGERILSAYTAANGVKLWVISETDRSSTAILLPEEY
jgi:hypothetical protein